MAQGITIDEVTNILDSTNIDGTEKIPVSSGETSPQVITTGKLKEYINDGVQGEISDLDTIRSGATAGATAYQKPGTGIPSTDLSSDVQTSLGKANTALQSFTEEDPTVPSWAKASSKPSYTASEVGAVPTTRTVNGKALSENISLTASDVGALPDNTIIPDAQIQSDWNQSDNTKKDYIKNKPTIPAAQIQSDWNQSTTAALDYIKNKPTIPTVPTNVSAFNNDAGYLTSHQDISGKADKATSATNGNFAALDSNGNLTDSGHKHSDYLTSHQDLSNYVQKSSTAGLLKNDGTVDTSTYLTQHQDLSNYIQKSSTSGLVKNDGTIDTNTYLTSAPVTSVNGQTGAVSLTLGDANVIETVKVNGSALTPDANKAVDITVPSVSGKEDTTNKVTSLSSSSTDTEYPSAKCVWDLVGDIETLLAAI